MTCDGCRSKVEKILNAVEGIEVKVSLNKPIATITMEKHIPITQLQEALSTVGKYTIEVTNGKTPQQVTTNEDTAKSCCSTHSHSDKREINVPVNAIGKYYCPMHCEGEKVYNKAGDCPVCGMDLMKMENSKIDLILSKTATVYTCSMHPEITSEKQGECPKCRMSLIEKKMDMKKEDTPQKHKH